MRESGFMGSRDRLRCFLVMASVATAMLVVQPFANLSYGDDTAYSFMALRLAQTGQFAYNGWQAAVMVFHTYWGALFLRVCGFSFDCLRMSTIPFSLGAVVLTYLLVRRAGLSSVGATFVTLMFGLSPLFLPVAVSYMTDVPALFFTFLSLYCFVRAMESAGSGGGLRWLLAGVAIGFVGGTSRQSAWLPMLLVLPYLAWARRGQRRFATAVLVTWIISLVAIRGVIRWFAGQPYTIAQPSIVGELKAVLMHPLPQANTIARLLLMLLLACLPAALLLAPQTIKETWRGSRLRKGTVLGLLVIITTAIALHPSLASIPWVANTLNWEGIFGNAPLPGRPVVLIRPIRAVVAVVVYGVGCLFVGQVTEFRAPIRRVRASFAARDGTEFTFSAMTLFSVAYFVLVVLRENDFDVFDRYLLPIIPWAATAILLMMGPENEASREDALGKGAPLAWAALGLVALYAIAITQDFWATARARAAAAHRLELAGVWRNRIDGGFEYNAWTELMANGRLNSHWVTYPPGAYRPGLGITPSVEPAYRLEYKPGPNTVQSPFGSVAFFSLTPPFHKQVSIDRIVGEMKLNQ